MPPEKHALLSASSAARWLNCTAAPRFEEGLPESTSEYAEEGRLAHAIAELKTLKKFTLMTSRTYTTRLNKLKKEPLYNPEMDKTTDLYMEHLTEQAMLYDSAPTVAAEVKVDFNDYVPEGFGTCDNVMIGGDTLSITDYKHGKGVPVSAVGNPQMRLYALGALKRYAPIFGDTIKKIRMSIDQPRLDSYTTDIITVEEPIEFVHPNKKSIVTQREVPLQTPSFADGLRASLREDSDIVLVGEMRDLETISLALTAAETGLLVFGTLHTNNASKTIDRIIDVFPSDQQSQVRTMLAGSLRGVVAQLLMKRSDKPGRVAVNEILFATPAVAAIIREGATQKIPDVIVGGKAMGMQFMDDAIWQKLQQGIVSPEEAYMKCIEKKRFRNFLPPESARLADSGGGN